MDDKQELFFSVDDKLLGEPISPENISLPLLAEFAEQVSTFLRGSNRLDLRNVKASVKRGSLAIAIEDSAQTLNDAIDDYKRISKSHSLKGVDPVRARIIEGWQQSAKRSDDRIYRLFFEAVKDGATPLIISSQTDFEIQKEVWVAVERYVYGRVYDLGGKNQPNVHLELESGKSIKIQASTDLLIDDKINRLYRRQLVRLKAEQNISTKEYRNETLLSFEHYKPHFDETEFEAIAKKARLAWRSIENAATWVEEMRGNYA